VLADLLKLQPDDVKIDAEKTGNLHLTSADAIRITSDLIGRGILNPDYLEIVKRELNVTLPVKPILHPNQYYHLLDWLSAKGHVTTSEAEKLQAMMKREGYTGI